jgi:uncharacterized protein with HEPN domain
MSRKRRDREYLADLAEAVQRIVVYTGELTYLTRRKASGFSPEI